jgi:hypothetical protein
VKTARWCERDEETLRRCERGLKTSKKTSLNCQKLKNLQNEKKQTVWNNQSQKPEDVWMKRVMRSWQNDIFDELWHHDKKLTFFPTRRWRWRNVFWQ